LNEAQTVATQEKGACVCAEKQQSKVPWASEEFFPGGGQ